MVDDFETDLELERLNSMHERVRRLRSQLKNLELDTYNALGTGEDQRNATAADHDGVSKNYG
jgi:hypothetical protein